MSTLSGNATKVEKGKKFQQLKINLCSANKPSEPEQQQHKSSIQRKQHGMTSLGKVPTARRPTNLPSEKSEHSGNDPSINLVPTGGAGWGNKQNETGPTTTPSVVPSVNTATNAPVNNATMPGTSPQVPLAQHYPPTSRMPPVTSMGPQHVPAHHGHADVKTWAVMAHGGETAAPNFLTPQSPLFQHEFPSLSSNSETSSATTPVTATAIQKPTANTIADTQYGPGPSLRPQTEGSWIHGGSRPQGPMGSAAGSPSATAPAPVRPMGPYPPAIGPDGARNNLGPSGAAVAPGGPYPQQHMIPPQFNGMMPPFMLRNFQSGTFPPPNFQSPIKGAGPRPPYGPFVPPHSAENSAKRFDEEDMKIRPIIKEEDLNHMASIGKDIGWAGHEDIDYNQKLKFSDDEDEDISKDNRSKMRTKTQSAPKGSDKTADKKDASDKENDLRSSKEKLYLVDQRNPEMRNAWQMRRTVVPAPAPITARYQIPANGRFEEDDETWQEKLRQKKEEMEVIVQRAKERREEEEKRFLEQQQAAAMKLRKLEAEMFATQSGNKENKASALNDKASALNDRDIDMLPPWEKEKFQAQNANSEDAKKSQITPVPVVKDASEFRELTQLVDKSNFVKKDVKERENVQQAGFSRAFNTNIPPRFQNMNRQNSSGFSSGTSSAPTRSIISQTSHSGKPAGTGYTNSRSIRRDSDSQSEKERDWNVNDARKDREADRYTKEPTQERKYGHNYDEDRHRKPKYSNEKDEYSNDSYNRELDHESSHASKIERKNSEGERDKIKSYDNRRYSESENQEKEDRRRSYEDSEKSRHYSSASSRSPRTFSESENHERKRSREEVMYENWKLYDADRDYPYYRKQDGAIREKSEIDHRDGEKERSRESSFVELKKEAEVKRNYEHEMSKKGKDSYKEERKSPSTYDDRLMRNDGRFHRESRESLRDDSYIIQEGRSYSWADESEIDDRKMRKDHYREDRSDRYSHAHRHPPRPITREKLEAKELELDSKGNLTALGRSDKKIELKRLELDDTKEKDEVKKPQKSDSATQQKSESQTEVPYAWKKDGDKKQKEETKSGQTPGAANDQNTEKNDGAKVKEEKKVASSKSSSKDEQGDKSGEDKRASDRRKSDRRSKESSRSWTRFAVYPSSSYGGRSEPKLRRTNRGATIKGPPRRDSKYSESEYSDEICDSGRKDGNVRNDREKSRPVKPAKRYERDDRNRDHRRNEPRGYGGGGPGGRNNRDDYYYDKPPAPRNRKNGFRATASGGGGTGSGSSGGGGAGASGNVGKRMDGYGPPPSKSPFGGSGGEEKRQKSSNKDSSSTANQSAPEKKNENAASGKQNTRSTVVGDRSWKKNIESLQSDNKLAVSSSTPVQTVEANEESFATASEGSDAEDMAQVAQKSKTGYAAKRAATVVATKSSRKTFRSTSRKRYENSKSGAGPLYSRKDSGSYSSGAKRNPPSSGNRTSSGNKENEKYSEEIANERRAISSRGSESKSSEKSSRDYGEGQNEKNLKSRNQSDLRKNTRNSGSGGSSVANTRKSSQDMPSRLQQGKPKVGDAKSDYKDFKNFDSSTSRFREIGPPIPAPPPTGNAWDKPLTGALRTGSPSTQRPVGAPAVSVPNSAANATAQDKSTVQMTEHKEPSALILDTSSSSVTAEKVTTKVLENLDGTTPPVQTIIFENKKFKSGPPDLSSKSKYNNQLKSHRFDKDSKLDSLDSNVHNFGNDSSNSELPSKHDPLHMTLFKKNEDVADMKLDFAFDSSDFSKLTEDSSKAGKAIELAHTMHMVQASTDADLNFKIASVKRVWDGSLSEHYDDKYDTGMVNSSSSFSPSFGSHSSDPNNGPCFSHIDSSGNLQVDDVSGLGHAEVVFSAVSQMQGVNSGYGSGTTVLLKNDPNACSNVCKVKPQPQGSVASMVNAVQSSIISTTLVSQPPPMSSPSYSYSCSTQQPNLSNGAMAASGLPPNFTGTQYNVPPVASPPVLYNPPQTPTAPSTGNLYQAFQTADIQVARSQYSQFSSYMSNATALGQTSGFGQQSMFAVQPPPSAPPTELFPQQMHQYRLQNAYGNAISNPNPGVLTSSSLMSATVKPSNAIGSKTGFQSTQSSSPMCIPMEMALISQSNVGGSLLFQPASSIIQRPPSNVMGPPSLASSTSYYTNPTPTGQTAYYQGTSSTLQQQAGVAAAAMGLAYNTQSATQSIGPALQNFNSQLNQPYKQTFMKNNGNTSNLTAADFASNKTITISDQHGILNSGFQPNPQLTNKPRMQPGNKNPQAVHQNVPQYSLPQNAYGYQPATNPMRNNGSANKGSQYPHPIQRPVSQGNNSTRGNGGGGNNVSNASASHRMPVRNNSHQLVNNIQPPSSVYYSTSSGYTNNSSKLEASPLESKNESNADAKLAESIKTLTVKNASAASDKSATSNE